MDSITCHVHQRLNRNHIIPDPLRPRQRLHITTLPTAPTPPTRTMQPNVLAFTSPLSPTSSLATPFYSRRLSLAPPRQQPPPSRTSRRRRRVALVATSAFPAASAPAPSAAEDAVESAIASGAVKELPAIIARDIQLLSYHSILRATSALSHSSNWRGVVRVFDAAASRSDIKLRFTSRLFTDFFFASMKLNNRRSAINAYDVFSRLVDEGLDSKMIGPKAYNFLYVALCRSAMVEEAIDVHDRCVSNGFYLNRYSYNTFLNACAKTNRVADAFNTLRAMAESNVPPDVVSCNVLIACCVRSDEMDVALTILDRMRDWGIPPDVYSYNSVINGFRKFRMLEEAFDLVARMEIGAGEAPIEDRQPPGAGLMEDSVKPDLVTYNTLISGIAAHEVPDLKRAREVYAHMKRGRIRCNEVTYNALMATAARADRVEEAFAIFGEMAAEGLKPNCECYTTLITLCGQTGQTRRAFSVHDKMIESGIEPSVVTFNALLTACRRGDRRHGADMALEVLEIMRQTPGCRPDVITYSTLIDTLGRDGRFTEVRDLLEAMMESGVQPNLVTYTSMISALSRAGDHDGAMRVVKDMERNGIEPNVYTFSCLINGAGRRKEIGLSVEVLNMMRDRGIKPSQSTYSMLLQMSVRSGVRENVVMVVKEIEREERLKSNTMVLEELRALARDDGLFIAGRAATLVESACAAIGEAMKDEGKAQRMARR